MSCQWRNRFMQMKPCWSCPLRDPLGTETTSGKLKLIDLITHHSLGHSGHDTPLDSAKDDIDMLTSRLLIHNVEDQAEFRFIAFSYSGLFQISRRQSSRSNPFVFIKTRLLYITAFYCDTRKLNNFAILIHWSGNQGTYCFRSSGRRH